MVESHDFCVLEVVDIDKYIQCFDPTVLTVHTLSTAVIVDTLRLLAGLERSGQAMFPEENKKPFAWNKTWNFQKNSSSIDT